MEVDGEEKEGKEEEMKEEEDEEVKQNIHILLSLSIHMKILHSVPQSQKILSLF